MARLKGTFDQRETGKVNTVAEEQITIKYEPFKEVIVMEKNFFSTPEDIARFTSIIAGGKAAGLYWAEGAVFLYFPLPASTETTAKMLVEHGRVYWTFLGYAFMPKYQPVIETRERMIVPIVDMTTNALMKKIATWLKEQK